MTDAQQLTILDKTRREVTKERLGFGCDGDMMTAAQLEADIKTAMQRLGWS